LQIEGLKFIMRVVGDESMHDTPVVEMKTLYEPTEANKDVQPLFALPGIEGTDKESSSDFIQTSQSI